MATTLLIASGGGTLAQALGAYPFQPPAGGLKLLQGHAKDYDLPKTPIYRGGCPKAAAESPRPVCSMLSFWTGTSTNTRPLRDGGGEQGASTVTPQEKQ